MPVFLAEEKNVRRQMSQDSTNHAKQQAEQGNLFDLREEMVFQQIAYKDTGLIVESQGMGCRGVASELDRLAFSACGQMTSAT